MTDWLARNGEKLDTATAMRSAISSWRASDAAGGDCQGHWAIVTRVDRRVVGGLSLQSFDGSDLTLEWALAISDQGNGYAAEACAALVRWALHEGGASEVFALLSPDNRRGVATARRIGMEWAFELQRGEPYEVYRVRHGDIGIAD